METVLEQIDRLNTWFWWGLSGVLLIAEVLTGTTYLIWPAAAAFLTGFAAMGVLGIAGILQLGLFSILSLVMLWAGDRWVRPRLKSGLNTGLNDRSHRVVGQTVIVATDFVAGTGRVRLGDTEWAGRMQDASNPVQGTVLRVVAVDGTVLELQTV